jgi:hypothetical protein
MGLLAKLLRQGAYSVSLDKARSTFHYREQGRSLHVSGEIMAHGYAVYSASIQQWENAPGDVIDEAERKRIAANIRSYYEERGRSVYLS